VELHPRLPRVLTSDHKARHYGRWPFCTLLVGGLLSRKRSLYRRRAVLLPLGVFPAILNLKLKPLQSYLLLTTLTSSQPKGTNESIVWFATSKPRSLWEVRKKIRRFRNFHAHCSKSISPDRRCPISKPTKPISAPCHYGPASEWVISATQPFLLTLI
jgi:hypothetical protein